MANERRDYSRNPSRSDTGSGLINRQPGRVLVVDDDEHNRALLRDNLEARGHEIIEAADGETALQIVAAQSPDVVLLDVMMPGLDGFEVCRRLKRDPETAAIPVLLVTALGDRQDRLTGIEAGANDFIIKPIDPRDLVLRVGNAVFMKHLYDELKRHNQRLEELERLRDNLTSMIVHDMKAPLGGIAGYLELLDMEAGEKLDEEQKGYVTEAREAAARLVRMADTLLDISRLEERRMPLTPSLCDLREIVTEAVREVESLAIEKDVRVTLSGDCRETVCDGEIIHRVVVNLVENAVTYAPEKSEIRITLEDYGDYVRVGVKDEGPGIPQQWHKKIFEKFGQVELRRERKLYSTGLGLTFCKLAVEAHQGEIGVKSEEGRGSLFWFSLPVTGPSLTVEAGKERDERKESQDTAG